MSFITLPDEDDARKEIPTLKHNKDTYVGNTVDSRILNVNTISSYIQGQRWVVDWYKQILNRDDAASTHSDRSLHVHKQYVLIRGVHLIVQQELQATQQSTGQRSFEMVGSSSVPFEITPAEGDIIVADIGDGREMEFTVTSTERTSIYEEAYIDVNYRAVRPVDAEIRHQLDSRVVSTKYFSRDNQRVGLKSLLTSEEATLKRDLGKLYGVLTRRYLRDFISERYSTLIVPGQDKVTYDPYLTRFVKAVVDATIYPEVHDISMMHLYGDELGEDETIWDCILHVDLTALALISSRTGIVNVENYRSRPLMGSIYFSGIKGVVRTLDPGYTVNRQHDRTGPHTAIQKAGAQSDQLQDIIPIQNLNDVSPYYQDQMNGLPYINRIVQDRYYIFSEEFYESKTPTSLLEKLVIDRIEKGTMDLKILSQLAELSLRFDNLERFYYTPIILALLRLSDGVM